MSRGQTPRQSLDEIWNAILPALSQLFDPTRDSKGSQPILPLESQMYMQTHTACFNLVCSPPHPKDLSLPDLQNTVLAPFASDRRSSKLRSMHFYERLDAYFAGVWKEDAEEQALVWGYRKGADKLSEFKAYAEVGSDLTRVVPIYATALRVDFVEQLDLDAALTDSSVTVEYQEAR
ncbi:hypothetical protein VNI00_004358 [Paramarasmius palmivorus]|uniref:Uncharacterized protein n=1 Tax=Paramarasmius palmivorus TaxID=297713 RepID=A0AAW0DRF8_9AGAR